MQLSRLNYNFDALKDSISAEYAQAMASFKANLNNFYFQKENLSIAQEVYNIIQMQYKAGIKTYLDVITANNDLFLSQTNYINALYQVLSNQIDVQRALGILKY